MFATSLFERGDFLLESKGVPLSAPAMDDHIRTHWEEQGKTVVCIYCLEIVYHNIEKYFSWSKNGTKVMTS